jgi:hypothetical protein
MDTPCCDFLWAKEKWNLLGCEENGFSTLVVVWGDQENGRRQVDQRPSATGSQTLISLRIALTQLT